MSHLSVAMTTTEETGITEGDVISSGSSRGIKFYFQLFVVITGVIGTAANGLVLYALVASKQHKKHVLIFHQNVLDLFSCFLLIICYSLKLCNVYLTGSTGYWLCMLILSDALIWWGVYGSVINLAVISVERYLKVVHPVWSKTNLRPWMIYSAMAFAWIASIVYNLAVVFPTTIVLDGECHVFVVFTSKSAQMVQLFSDFVSFYVLIIVIFILCYWRILAAVRRQARVMAGHRTAGSSAGQTHSNHIQTNVIKTMILICTFYAISWLPMNAVTFLWSFAPNLHKQLATAYYISMFLEVLYICTNPFIYAAKFHPVKRVLIGMIICKKTTEQASGNVP